MFSKNFRNLLRTAKNELQQHILYDIDKHYDPYTEADYANMPAVQKVFSSDLVKSIANVHIEKEPIVNDNDKQNGTCIGIRPYDMPLAGDLRYPYVLYLIKTLSKLSNDDINRQIKRNYKIRQKIYRLERKMDINKYPDLTY